MKLELAYALTLVAVLALVPACTSDESGAASHGGRPSGHGGRPGGPDGPGDGAVAAVPVEVQTVERRDISSYIETNGTLEAENEVDVVARGAGPIVELHAEEGMPVAEGELLATLEQDEIRAQLQIAQVRLDETGLAFDRARSLQTEDLISEEEFEQARAAFESAEAEFEGNRVQYAYTEIRAPFAGLIVSRYVDFGQHVPTNTALFRISDFTPLLCPIQVPERELPKLRKGQRAYLTVDAWPDQRFAARVLRVSPVVDAATGTVKVTLDVDSRDLLRPGMFARVFLETDVRRDALVIPKAALSLESIGDTVYVNDADAATRREVTLGFRQGDDVEVLSGLAVGEQVVVVGQDGLSQGTPIRVLRSDGAAVDASARSDGEHRGPGSGGGRPPDFPDPANMTPEQLERMKQRMRERGLTDEQITERLERMPGASSE